MPTFRQAIVANITRNYPLYSGCGTFANKAWIHRLAGESNEQTWSHVPGGEVLASLDDYVGRAAYYVGDLDRKITWICQQLVQPGDTVLDIGANVGLVSLLLAKLVGERGQVHAFEPNPKLQQVLNKTFEHNQISNVRLYPIALGSEAGQMTLRVPRGNAGGASLMRNANLTNYNSFEVPIKTLSQVVTQENIESIQFIKIDVEGFEAEVFKGGQDILESMRPEAILFELNEKSDQPVSDRPIIKILREAGYGFFSIPKCMFRMHLERFEPEQFNQLVGHDLLAVPKGESYEKTAKLVNAVA